MTNAEDRARDALEAQGFKAPGPKLHRSRDGHGRAGEEGMPSGSRTHEFDDAELLADTPELRDRAGGGDREILPTSDRENSPPLTSMSR